MYRSIMPLATFGAVMLWAASAVPVRVFDDDRFEDVTTVIGSLNEASAIAYLLVTAAATTLLVLLWRRPARRGLALGLVGAGVAAAFLVTLPGAGDTILWDGQDSAGRPTGGMVRMVPAPGMWIGVGGGVLVAAAGLVAGFVRRVSDPALGR